MAYWFRNRADAQVFKNWRLIYDETFSSGKSKSMYHKSSGCTANTGAIPKTGTSNQQTTIPQKVTKITTSKNSGVNTVNPTVHTEVNRVAPLAIDIRPSEVLRICNEVLKMGFEASTLQRADFVREQLEKLSRSKNPANKPIPLMDVNTPINCYL